MAVPTAGRRDSRIHLQLRHSDALQEHESFRRKYLLVNKHITKLNAGLNLRVEELNVQITQLNSENIGLRAKVIELTRRLAAEQATTRKTAAEAENLAANAVRQLTSLRDAFAGLATPIATPPAPLPSLAPREPVARAAVAKKPSISFIREASLELEEVPIPRSILRAQEAEDPSPSPPGPAAFITSRRTSRRPTAPVDVPELLPTTSTPRTHMDVLVVSSEEEVESELETPPSVAARSIVTGKGKSKVESVLARQKSPEVDEPMPTPGATRKRIKSKDVDMGALREESGEESARVAAVRKAVKRRPLTPPPASAVASTSSAPGLHARSSSIDVPDDDAEEQPEEGLRERRTRKSVNYAEPKLNTKMRKPEGFGGGRPRTSTAAREHTSTPRVSAASSSKTPSTTSIRTKPPAGLPYAGPSVQLSDAEEEIVPSKATSRRHSLAV